MRTIFLHHSLILFFISPLALHILFVYQEETVEKFREYVPKIAQIGTFFDTRCYSRLNMGGQGDLTVGAVHA